MQQLVNSLSHSLPITVNNSDNHAIIYYNFVGNFVPPEWRELKNSCGKVLSKTARQLLSLIVFRLQVCNGSNLDELQESYHFFEQSLGICQRRVRQCMLELQEGGFIDVYNATIVKQHIKCRNIPCIKLAKNFRPYPKNFSGESEKNFESTRKKFQPHNIIDINNKSNISRSNESDFLKNSIDKNEQGQEQFQDQTQESLQEQQQTIAQLQEPLHEQNLQLEEVQVEMVVNETEALAENAIEGLVPLSVTLQTITEKVFKQNELATTDASNQHSPISDNNNGWFKRKRLADFYPLTEEDGDLLQLRSNREFNLSFINQLLLKLAEQYPDHHFCNKKVVMNYMTKALVHELRESNKVNCSNFQFKTNDPDQLKSQYLKKIECTTSTSKQAQLKRKIAGIFNSDTAYELLTFCEFIEVVSNQYQVKLLKDISLSERMKAKILEQVQAVYGSKINQLQIIPFTQSIVQKQENKTEDNDQAYLVELNKLNPNSMWYKVRCALIKNHGKHTDSSIFSKLEVIEEDIINRKIILKPTTAFIDYWVRQRHIQDLKLAFQVQGFIFELLALDRSG